MGNEKNIFNDNLRSTFRDFKLPIRKDVIWDRAGVADMWYPENGENVIDYLRERDVLPYLLTQPSDRKAFFEKKHQSIKPGKFLVKLGLYDYDLAHRLAATLKPPEIVIVSGNMIKWFYHENLYAPVNTGTLGSSCMCSGSMTEWFQLYADNARMAMIYKAGQITSRAILWDNVKLQDRTFTFMDRIYGIEESVERMKAFARKKGYAYKRKQSYSEHNIELDGKVLSFAEAFIDLKKPLRYDRPLPYLDSFPYGLYLNEKLITLRNTCVAKSVSIRFTNGGSRTRYCPKCGSPMLQFSTQCSSCGYQKMIYKKTCPICKEQYSVTAYMKPHFECLPTMQYTCVDCNEDHIANSKEEFNARSCKEEKWTTDGGTVTSTIPESK